MDDWDALRFAGVAEGGVAVWEDGSGTFFFRPPRGSQPLGGPRFFWAPYSQAMESFAQLLQGWRPSHLTLRREQWRQALLDRMRVESLTLVLGSAGDIDDDGFDMAGRCDQPNVASPSPTLSIAKLWWIGPAQQTDRLEAQRQCRFEIS